MFSFFGRKKLCKCLREWSFQPNGMQLILLVLIHLTFNHVQSEGIIENNYDDLDDTYVNSTASRNGKAVSERSNVHSFRFRNFEPRSMAEFTVPTATKIQVAEIKTKDVAENMSHKLMESVLEKRKARFIHFEADGKDLSINLEFIVPVFRVPIERSFKITKTAFRKLADLNSGTLLVGGGLAVVGALVAAVVKTVTTPTVYGYGYKKATRGTDFTEGFNFVSYDSRGDDGITMKRSVSKVQGLLNILERNLYANNVNVRVCAQRAICDYVQRATAGVKAGLGSPTERIVDGLVNLDLLRIYLNGTALKRAIDLGHKSNASTCEHIYRNCEWSSMENTAWKIAATFLASYLERLR